MGECTQYFTCDFQSSCLRIESRFVRAWNDVRIYPVPVSESVAASHLGFSRGATGRPKRVLVVSRLPPLSLAIEDFADSVARAPAMSKPKHCHRNVPYLLVCNAAKADMLTDGHSLYARLGFQLC